MPEPASPLLSSMLQAPKRTQSTMNGTQVPHGKAERWGTWSHPKRPRKQILLPSSPQTPSPSQRGASALRQVFQNAGEPPETPASSHKQQHHRQSQSYQQHRQQKSASAPRPRTGGRAPIPHFRTYSHTQSSAAKSRAAAAPEPEDEDAQDTARIHAWLDRVVDELIAAEEVEAGVEAEVHDEICDVQIQPAAVYREQKQSVKFKDVDIEPAKADVQPVTVRAVREVRDVEVEVPSTSHSQKGHPAPENEVKPPKTPTKTPRSRLALDTDLPRVDSGWGTASPVSISMAFMTPRTVPRIDEDTAVWELLSPNVTPFRKGKGPKRTRRRSYYDEDIWPSGCNSPQSLAPPVHQVQALS
ncbi:uncharacterized protein GIQ15_05104 [Arthroderma uncinatum]|uniref:uncharacterized protein n=1 Tax=Arthroderma uncinatum TaxID=74035 RepID=UPI00144A8784|nr:uncharacterized protein GIQ15_05104 [Arthroderma uncinatum]KAF3482345.1 hypothetical protein GIQ15_05104 [Arthroderma uncinatum]